MFCTEFFCFEHRDKIFVTELILSSIFFYMEFKKIYVAGCGTMGNGIAQVAAMSGLEVIMSDIKDEFVKRGFDAIAKNLSRSVEKGKMPAEERDAVIKRIKTTTDLKDMAGVVK